MLSFANNHKNDSHIQFKELGHVYTIRGRTDFISITTIVKSLFEEFDAHLMITKILESDSMRNVEYKYYGMTYRQIFDMWNITAKDASSKGTALHLYIENYYNGVCAIQDTPELKQFHAFAADFAHLRPYRTEWMIYYEKYKLCGTIDMVFENTETGSLEIYDWKRVREIKYTSYQDKTSTVLPTIMDSNFWHYAVQLNMYRRMLQDQYDKPITALYLVVFHPEQKAYDRIEVPMMDKEMDQLLNWRLRCIQEGVKGGGEGGGEGDGCKLEGKPEAKGRGWLGGNV